MSSGFPENYPMAVPAAVVQPAAQPNYALWAGAILAFLIIGVIIVIIVASQSKNSTVSASVNSSAASSDSSDETDSSSDTISVPIDDSAHLGIPDNIVPPAGSGLPPSDAAKNAADAADAANKIAIADVAISIANGAPIYCTGYNPKGAGAVYRYVSPKTIQWYPNPTIAQSYDPNWALAKSYNCTGFTLGPDLARAPSSSGGSQSDPCSGFVSGSLSAACYQSIWNTAGCTTKLSDTTNPSLSGQLNWANSNKLSLDALKDDAKTWATMNDSAHILGCYVTKPAPSNIRMYGPAIGHPVGNQEILPTGVYQKGDNLIYLLKDGPYIKMVNKSGAARHYAGDISSFNPSNWSNYNDSTGGYFIKTV